MIRCKFLQTPSSMLSGSYPIKYNHAVLPSRKATTRSARWTASFTSRGDHNDRKAMPVQIFTRSSCISDRVGAALDLDINLPRPRRGIADQHTVEVQSLVLSKV
jgi:hypothetical protein